MESFGVRKDQEHLFYSGFKYLLDSHLQMVIRSWHVTGILEELGHVCHDRFLIRIFNINI